MNNELLVNKDVSVVACYSNNANQPNCFPRRMRYGGKIIEFSEIGLRHPTQKGQRMVHVFDMTDGQADYRLEFDGASLRWKLIYVADKS